METQEETTPLLNGLRSPLSYPHHLLLRATTALSNQSQHHSSDQDDTNDANDANNAPTPPAVVSNPVVTQADQPPSSTSLVLISQHHSASSSPGDVFICSLNGPLHHGQQLHVITSVGHIFSTTISKLALDVKGQQQSRPGSGCGESGIGGSSEAGDASPELRLRANSGRSLLARPTPSSMRRSGSLSLGSLSASAASLSVSAASLAAAAAIPCPSSTLSAQPYPLPLPPPLDDDDDGSFRGSFLDSSFLGRRLSEPAVPAPHSRLLFPSSHSHHSIHAAAAAAAAAAANSIPSLAIPKGPLLFSLLLAQRIGVGLGLGKLSSQLAAGSKSESTSSTDEPGNTIPVQFSVNEDEMLPYLEVSIDGINLEEIKEFAKLFKMKRLSLGLTQTQVGQALSMTEGPAYSQSAICRFEKLDITPKSAQKIKPVLERWMEEMDEKLRNGEIRPANPAAAAVSTSAALCSVSAPHLQLPTTTAANTATTTSLPANGMAALTCGGGLTLPRSESPHLAAAPVSLAPADLSPPAPLLAASACDPCLSPPLQPPPTSSSLALMLVPPVSLPPPLSTSPTGLGGPPNSLSAAECCRKRKRRTSFTPQALDILNQFFARNTHPSGGEMTALAESLGYDREVVRVWFCNKRQALKNTMKKLKASSDFSSPLSSLHSSSII